MIEPAKVTDWDDFKRLSVQIHDLHAAWRPDIYFHSDEPYPQENFLEDVRNGRIYVARERDNLLGYAVISIQKKGGSGTNQMDLLRVDSICVDEALRGRGIGKTMMAKLSELAKEMGCAGLLLGVHPENRNALEFYRACGFGIRTVNMEKKV